MFVKNDWLDTCCSHLVVIICDDQVTKAKGSKELECAVQ
jgi:hypothetical protein